MGIQTTREIAEKLSEIFEKGADSFLSAPYSSVEGRMLQAEQGRVAVEAAQILVQLRLAGKA